MGFVPPFPNLFVQPRGIVGHLLLVVQLLEISGNTVICYSMNRCAKFCGYFQNHFLASYSEVGAESETKRSPCFKPRTDHLLCSQLVAFLVAMARPHSLLRCLWSTRTNDKLSGLLWVFILLHFRWATSVHVASLVHQAWEDDTRGGSVHPRAPSSHPFFSPLTTADAHSCNLAMVCVVMHPSWS